MADYTIVWDSANLDSFNDYTSVNHPLDTVHVDISTPPNIHGEQWGLSGQVGQGTLESDFPTPSTPTVVFVDFHEDVANATFKLYDVDGNPLGGGLNWDDKVTIQAVDAFGDPVATIYTDQDGQIVTGNTIEGNGNLDVHTYVTVSFAGPITSFTVTFTNGANHPQAGYVGIGNVTFDELYPSCFVRGTLIETDRGEVAIEALMIDDLVLTADNGFQPIRWIGSTTVKASGSNAPVLFRKGAIGNARDLMLSPAHRVMLRGWQSELLFGAAEILTSAKSLINDSSIVQHSADKVEYFHVLFDRHEIVFSNGAPTESFHPGKTEVGILAQQARDEIFSLFPELAQDYSSYGPPARKSLRAHEAALLNL